MLNWFRRRPLPFQSPDWEKVGGGREVEFRRSHKPLRFIQYCPPERKRYRIDDWSGIIENDRTARKDILNDYNVLSIRNLMFGKYNASEMIDENTGPKKEGAQDEISRYIRIEIDGKFLHLSIYTVKEHFREDNEVFDSVLGSFEWK